MRWLCLIVLALSGTALAAPGLPRGDDHFHLAMSRSEVDSAVADRGLNVLSSGLSHITCTGAGPIVEYEQYDFVPSTSGQGQLWRLTVAYRVPYRRADFDSLRRGLAARLGEPAQVEEPDPRDVGATHRVTWVDVRTSVQLAARWNERPDPQTDRMLVVWTDRRLQKLVEAQQRNAPPSKRKR
jgi:hypothetical protein